MSLICVTNNGGRSEKTLLCLGSLFPIQCWGMVFNANFNNSSVLSWRSVLLMEKTGDPGENHRPAVSHWQTWSHNAYWDTSPWTVFKLTTLVVVGTACTSSCKSNCHTITTSTTPNIVILFLLHWMFHYYALYQYIRILIMVFLLLSVYYIVCHNLMMVLYLTTICCVFH